MTREEVRIQLISIFQRVFEYPFLEIVDTTTAKDIDKWTSLNHMQLIVEIEKNFKLKFSLKEVMSFKKVGDIIDCIIEKKADS